MADGGWWLTDARTRPRNAPVVVRLVVGAVAAVGVSHANVSLQSENSRNVLGSLGFSPE